MSLGIKPTRSSQTTGSISRTGTSQRSHNINFERTPASMPPASRDSIAPAPHSVGRYEGTQTMPGKAVQHRRQRRHLHGADAASSTTARELERKDSAEAAGNRGAVTDADPSQRGRLRHALRRSQRDASSVRASSIRSRRTRSTAGVNASPSSNERTSGRRYRSA